MSAMQAEGKITALNERLSRDDDIAGDSNSIKNQKSYLEGYALQQGMTNCVHYTDDGWSGGNFDRPGWKRLVADIEAGKVGTVLVKDMSRIGRDYLQTGFYTEVMFRQHVVRRIFQLTIEGKGPYDIARILYDEKIEAPAVYFGKQGIGAWKNRADYSNPYNWYGETVSEILARPEYMGHTVNFRTHKESYKDKCGVPNPKEEWLIFENTHEAIVDKETWELAQKLRKTPKRIDTIGEANPFTGLVYCADCGAKMYNHRSRGNGTTSFPTDFFDCSAYTLGYQKHLHSCSSHYIRTKALRTLVLETIRTASTYAIENQEEFLDKVRSASQMRQATAAKDAKRKLNKERKRVEELENVIQKLYESYAVGKVSEERFDSLLARYEEEQKILRASVADAEQQLAVFAEDTARADQFLSLAKKYTDFSELTTPMLNEFVDKIIVHAPEKIDGDRVQEIEIYLKFIGRFDLPAPNPTPEEIEREAFLRKERIRSRKRYQEIKQGTRVRNQPVDLVCKSCGKVFQSKRSDTLFCCVNCRAKYYRQEAAEQRKQDHTCANCGNSFVSQKKNVKYCCTECRDEKLALMRQERNKARNEKKAAVIPESEIE